MTVLWRVYSLMLYAYPKQFRLRFGAEMQQLFRDGSCQALASNNVFHFLLESTRDWLVSVIKERTTDMWHAFIKDRRWLPARGLALAVVTVFAYFFVTTTIVQAFVIPTPSMETSLRVGDHLLISKLGHDLHHGDLVAFRYPEDERQTFIKRVIGLPGDRIRLVNKQVIRNGRRLLEPYVLLASSSIDSYRDNFPADLPYFISDKGRDMLARYVTNGEVTVPIGTLFVLGDNRDNSLDSRYWGFVPAGNVVGRPWMVYWSYDARTSELVQWNVPHLVDVARHFFSKTRWERTLMRPNSGDAEEVAP